MSKAATRQNGTATTAPDVSVGLPAYDPAAVPDWARDFLHLCAIQAWQAAASGKPAPRIDPVVLYQEMYEALETGDGTNLFDQFDLRWEEIAEKHGFPIADEAGDLLPEVNDAITNLIVDAIWFGITTGYFTLTGSYSIPRRFTRWA